MSKNARDITDMPYTQWLEQALHKLTNFQKVRGICIAATTDSGDIYSNYYNVTMADKLILAGIIQQDAMFDSMEENGIIEYSNDEDRECDEEDVYDEEEE